MGQHPDRAATETPIPTDWFGFAAQVRNTRSIHPAENLYELNVLKGIGWEAGSTNSGRVSQRGSAQVMNNIAPEGRREEEIRRKPLSTQNSQR